MKVYIEREDRNVDIPAKDISTVSDILNHLKINPVTVIVIKNDEVVAEKEKISSKDRIKIISVVSGG